MWVGNLDDRNLTKIAVPERSNAGTVSLENRTPTGIATGEGAVWVAHGRLGSVSRVDPQFTRVTDTIPVVGFPTGLVGGAVTVGSGSVWATFSDSTLARIDPVRLEVTGRALAGSQPSSIAYGAGAIWVANALDADVQRFNPLTFEEGPVDEPSVGARPLAVAVGAGAVWVANSSDDTVTRIGITSGATRTIDVGDGPSAVAYGSGSVWVANTDGRSVTRIDPATGDVTATIPVGNAPAGLAIAGDLVWVSMQAP